jgi:hypothetical protein
MFLADKELKIIGYKADFEKLEYGLFFFNHLVEGCKSTITIPVYKFLELYKGKLYKERKTGTVECPGYCRKKEQLDRCDALCECAYVREIINIVEAHEKEEVSI